MSRRSTTRQRSSPTRSPHPCWRCWRRGSKRWYAREGDADAIHGLRYLIRFPVGKVGARHRSQVRLRWGHRKGTRRLHPTRLKTGLLCRNRLLEGGDRVQLDHRLSLHQIPPDGAGLQEVAPAEQAVSERQGLRRRHPHHFPSRHLVKRLMALPAPWLYPHQLLLPREEHHALLMVPRRASGARRADGMTLQRLVTPVARLCLPHLWMWGASGSQVPPFLSDASAAWQVQIPIRGILPPSAAAVRSVCPAVPTCITSTMRQVLFVALPGPPRSRRILCGIQLVKPICPAPRLL